MCSELATAQRSSYKHLRVLPIAQLRLQPSGETLHSSDTELSGSIQIGSVDVSVAASASEAALRSSYKHLRAMPIPRLTWLPSEEHSPESSGTQSSCTYGDQCKFKHIEPKQLAITHPSTIQENQENPPIVWQVHMDSSDDEDYQKATVTYSEELGEEVIEW